MPRITRDRRSNPETDSRLDQPTTDSVNVPTLGLVSYEHLGTLSAKQLNDALSANVIPIGPGGTNIYNLFNEPTNGKQAAVPFTNELGAKNSVAFYRLIYNTKIPENNQFYKVSGLLALPVSPQKGNTIFSPLKLMSWQHGTILSPDDAPSSLIRNGEVVRSAAGIPPSAETLFNSVRFAGNGYVLTAADYIGNGISTETQAYMVKGATIQTTRDMITGASAVIQRLRSPQSNSRFIPRARFSPISKLFLNGWSQGGLNTQWLASALQNDNITVQKQAQASAPTDLLRVASYWLNDYPGSPNWLTSAVPILLGSYEKFYGIKDLMQTAVRPEYLQTANKIYNKQIDWSTVQSPREDEGLLGLPLTPKQMLNSAFLDEFNAGRGEFYSRLKANTAIEKKYKWPTRFYGGSGDNVVPPNIAINTPVAFQESTGSKLSSGLDMGPSATHRSTFLSSLFDGVINPGNSLLTWFNA